MKWIRADIYPGDLARIIAHRPHGGIVSLWRWGPKGSPHSVVEFGATETEVRAKMKARITPTDPKDCVFIGVEELLTKIGIKPEVTFTKGTA